jgi:hypothetical protein
MKYNATSSYDPGVDGTIIRIQMDLQEGGWVAHSGLFWLRIGTGGGAFVNALMNLRVP